MNTSGLKHNRIIDLLPYQIERDPLEKAFCDKVTGSWRSYSSRQAKEIIDKVSLGLLALGVKPGDRIGIISGNRVEWNFIDIGLLQIGAVNVPLYPNTSEDNYRYIIKDAEIKILFVENSQLYEKVKNVEKLLGRNLDEIYTFDPVKNVKSWEQLLENADEVNREKLNELFDKVDKEDLASVIYTSGTTGEPKGVRLTHFNIISNVLSLAEIMPHDTFSRTISFLPLCHIFERTAVYFYMYLSRSVHYPESLEKLAENIKEVKPHYFITVPRLFEKIYEKIMEKGHELSFPKKAIFGWAVNLANHFHPMGYNNWFYNFRLFFARKLVFDKWVDALGGELKSIISGSATLQPKLARIFTAAGIQVIQGYGLTEASPVLTSNRFEKGSYNLGTVGPPIPGVEIKIADNGEILAKGPNVMKGYYNKPEDTKKAIDEEGWFHTGDIGEFVDGNFLKITGRLKEIFKNSGGKFIAPQPIENKMRESFFIEHIMVVGENEKFTGALILPEFEFLKKWCQGKGLKFNSNYEMIASERVKNRIMKEVNKYNKRFGHVQQVKKIALVADTWSVETGELTPTLKLKRKIIKEKYKKEIDSIYRDNSSIK